MPEMIQIDDIHQAQALFGNNDEYIHLIEDAFDVVIHARGQEVAVQGQQLNEVSQAEEVLKTY